MIGRVRGAVIVFVRCYRSQADRGPARVYWALRNWWALGAGKDFVG